MPLSRQDIITQSPYKDQNGAFCMDVYAPLFDQTVELYIYPETMDLETLISEIMTARINSFLETRPSELAAATTAIWEHYINKTSDTEYEMVPEELLEAHDGDYGKANQAFFGFENAEETLQALQVGYVYFDDSNDPEHSYYMIHCTTPWEPEHGLNVFFMDGKYISME